MPPIAANSPLSSDVANNTFMDRQVDTSTVGRIDLNNALPESGAPIVNVQATINGLSIIPVATVSVPNGSQIDLTTSKVQYIRVVGDGAPVVVDPTPFSSPPADGTTIYLVGTDDTDTVTLQFNDTPFGAYINGDATLKRGYTLTLIYDGVLQRYVEISRNF